MYKILFIALVSILLFTWMFIISKKLSIITGSFIFDTDVFYYETLRKSYEINYNEVAYISKEYRIDGNSFFNLERIIYRIKIKDAGSFVYYYEDDSLVKAINVLAKKLDMKIIDKTKE